MAATRETEEHPEFMGWGADTNHHVVRLSWHELVPAPVGVQSHETLLSPLDALALSRSLAAAAASALEQQLSDALAGECETCGNLRMVDVPKSAGRTEREHCPDCWPRTLEPPPTLEVWRADEARILRRGR